MNDPHILESARTQFANYGDASWLLSNPKQVKPKLGPAIYISDVESSRTLILETTPDALQQLAEQVDIDKATHEQIRIALSLLIGDLLSSTEGIHPDTRRGVTLGAALHITQTRGFHITKHHGGDVQHVLVRYPTASQGHMLVPMPIFKAHPIVVTDLDSTVTHILMSEQLNFPERFANGQLLRFKELRRHVLAGK